MQDKPSPSANTSNQGIDIELGSVGATMRTQLDIQQIQVQQQAGGAVDSPKASPRRPMSARAKSVARVVAQSPRVFVKGIGDALSDVADTALEYIDNEPPTSRRVSSAKLAEVEANAQRRKEELFRQVRCLRVATRGRPRTCQYHLAAAPPSKSRALLSDSRGLTCPRLPPWLSSGRAVAEHAGEAFGTRRELVAGADAAARGVGGRFTQRTA